MSIQKKYSAIHVRNIDLWAHVGVLDKERLNGQQFLLDVSIWLDIEAAEKGDDVGLSKDYSLIIKSIQKLSFQINCKTIEVYSEKILDAIEVLCGQIPVKIILQKCSPPVDGFTGYVSIERHRYFQLLK